MRSIFFSSLWNPPFPWPDFCHFVKQKSCDSTLSPPFFFHPQLEEHRHWYQTIKTLQFWYFALVHTCISHDHDFCRVKDIEIDDRTKWKCRWKNLMVIHYFFTSELQLMSKCLTRQSHDDDWGKSKRIEQSWVHIYMMPPIIHRSMFYSLYRFSISQTRQNHSNMT